VRGGRDKQKSEALEASRILLAPLVDLLLRLGVSAGDFSALSKAVYVNRAAEHVRASSGRSSISRVAIVTGLTRAEVTKLLKSAGSNAEARSYQRHRADRVVHGWRTDPEFCSKDGHPRALPLKGPVRSFASLVKKYSGDIPMRAMLDQLVSTHLIVKARDGTIRLSRRPSVGSRHVTGSIRQIGEQVGVLVGALIHNLDAPDKLYVGSTSAHQNDEHVLSLLRDRLARDGRHFLETVAEQLQNPPRSVERKATAGPVKLGLTVFVYEGRRPRRSEQPRRPRSKAFT